MATNSPYGAGGGCGETDLDNLIDDLCRDPRDGLRGRAGSGGGEGDGISDGGGGGSGGDSGGGGALGAGDDGTSDEDDEDDGFHRRRSRRKGKPSAKAQSAAAASASRPAGSGPAFNDLTSRIPGAAARHSRVLARLREQHAASVPDGE